MRLRQASGDFLRECCQMRMTFHPLPRSWRVTRRSRAMVSSRLLMLLPPASSTLRAAPQRSLSEPPLRFRVVPEGAVGFRAGVANGAAVPKTSVDKDGDLPLGKSKVGLSWQREMPPPSGDLVLSQQDQRCLLGLLVPLPPDERHDFRALLSRPDICHESELVES